ncbi:Glycosyl transferases involved in cell wall biogenesis [Streptococcus infantarius subsp. infantarius]|nr:Glycosyl transferases involved in cell wall biogenesis [Streptococcus infantarius subsp. infantarius]
MKKSDKPLISIIVPVYNTGLYLQKCIESLINQSYENIEIILVNDGSTDNSKQICESYKEKDNRIKVIHKKNEGVSRARNTGIHHSSGEYLCFVDGDDFVMQEYVEYLYELIGDESDISLTTDMFGNFNKNQVSKEVKELWTPEKAVESILCYRVPIGCYCKMFKREFILKNNLLFSSDIFIGEGFNFNVDCFQRANSVVRGNRKVYYYRRDNELSATTKFSEEKWVNGIYALDYMNERFFINTEKIKNAWEYAKWRTYSDAYDAMILSGEINYKSEFYMECNANIRLGFWKSLKVPVSLQDKIRAFVLMVCPKMIPAAMKIRKKIYIRK